MVLLKSNKTYTVLRLFSLNNRIFGTKKNFAYSEEQSNRVELRDVYSYLGTLKFPGAIDRLLQGAGVEEGTGQ